MENSVSFLEKKNVFVLAICQVLFNTGQGLIFASAPLVGLAIAPDQSLATLPISVLLVGTVIATLPAPLLMRRIGLSANSAHKQGRRQSGDHRTHKQDGNGKRCQRLIRCDGQPHKGC